MAQSTAAASDEAWATRPLAKGEAVRVFYHMNDHPSGYRYVRVLNSPPEGTPEAVAKIGLSTGWVPATVREKWEPGASQDGRVLVKMHGLFADVYNMDPEPVKGMWWRVDRSLVRPMGTSQAKTELSLLVVRWWDYWNRANRKSRSHNVANEEMLLDVLEGPGSPHGTFGKHGNYEVHTAFIRDSDDLEAIGQTLVQGMRGQRKAGLYFLWPTQRLSKQRLAGCVHEPSLLGLMDRMESFGVASCWPHGSNLYRQLAGKLWVPRVSAERLDLRVPPTIQVDVEGWKKDPDSVVQDILSKLSSFGGKTPGDVTTYRGVAKLGFSWMGEDVLPFTGPHGLSKALLQLLDDAKPDAVCLVQHRVEDVVCEMRLVCCRDLAAGPDAVKMELVRMRLRPPRHQVDESFALTGHTLFSEAEALQIIFRGDAKAMAETESEVFRLGRLWFAWLRDEGYGVPGSCRLDFLVSMSKSQKRADLWTVEVCECGGSLCCFTHQARTTAILNECCATGSFSFEYTLEQHHQAPMSQHLENLRLSRCISEEDWRIGLRVMNSKGNQQDLSISLEEEQFPMKIHYEDSSALAPLPLPPMVQHEMENANPQATTSSKVGRNGGAAPTSSRAASSSGVLARWLPPSTRSRTGILLLLGLIILRLFRRR